LLEFDRSETALNRIGPEHVGPKHCVVGNAVAAATGQRSRDLPLKRSETAIGF
jgi:hypothetical protein